MNKICGAAGFLLAMQNNTIENKMSQLLLYYKLFFTLEYLSKAIILLVIIIKVTTFVMILFNLSNRHLA